jgi:queuine tRNA-ribosyltransferase
MMDCVLPTRNARNGCLYTSTGPLHIRNAPYANDSRPVDESCGCKVCQRHSRGYLRHLYQANEMLGAMLGTYHNLYFYMGIMRDIRERVRNGEPLRELQFAANTDSADTAACNDTE